MKSARIHSGALYPLIGVNFGDYSPQATSIFKTKITHINHTFIISYPQKWILHPQKHRVHYVWSSSLVVSWRSGCQKQKFWKICQILTMVEDHDARTATGVDYNQPQTRTTYHLVWRLSISLVLFIESVKQTISEGSAANRYRTRTMVEISLIKQLGTSTDYECYSIVSNPSIGTQFTWDICSVPSKSQLLVPIRSYIVFIDQCRGSLGPPHQLLSFCVPFFMYILAGCPIFNRDQTGCMPRRRILPSLARETRPRHGLGNPCFLLFFWLGTTRVVCFFRSIKLVQSWQIHLNPSESVL